MSILKEAMEEMITEGVDELERAEYVFEALDKLNEDAEDMQALIDDLNMTRLRKNMKSLGLSGDFDDIEERIEQLQDVLAELVDDDLGAVLPGLEQQIEELQDETRDVPDEEPEEKE